jgi:hypothetical protein
MFHEKTRKNNYALKIKSRKMSKKATLGEIPKKLHYLGKGG